MKKMTIFLTVLLLLLGCSKKDEVKAVQTEKTVEIKTEGEGAKVFFTKDISGEGVMRIYEMIADSVRGNVALKTHFGESGNKNYLKADLSKPLVQKLGATYVETNVLYGGKRGKTESHIKLAKDHGFDFAPIDILESEGEKEIPVKGLKHFDKVVIGEHMDRYDTFILFSHFKGHGMAGFGGAIKNVSMGFGTPRGKRAMHARQRPLSDIDKCIKCGLCKEECPENAIEIGDVVVIDPYKCSGCGKCASLCPTDALFIEKQGTEIFMEKLVEYVKGIDENYHMVYINVLANISKSCDCMGSAPAPFTEDIGIVAGTDIVAVEKASLDLVNRATGHEDTFEHVNHISGNRQIEYAAELGLGTENYVLVDIDK